MKKIFPFLVLLFFLQSCSVYQAGSPSVEEAVAANNKVRIVTADNQKLKFRRLEMEDDLLTGITKAESNTAKKLAGMPSQSQGRYVQIDLSQIDIEEIKLRNNTLSTILNIGVPVVVAFTGLLVLATSILPPGY